MRTEPVRFRVAADFEDIVLDDVPAPRKTRGAKAPPPVVRRSTTDSMGSDELLAGVPGTSIDSNVSTPTLTSDTSSLRSSMSSFSSPALHSVGSGPSVAVSQNQSQTTSPTPTRRQSVPTLLGMGIDNTSMASLSRLPSVKSTRTRKQREADFENDEGEDFWPAGGFMFNVPMSPALYRQQLKQNVHTQTGKHARDPHQRLPQGPHTQQTPHGLRQTQLPHSLRQSLPAISEIPKRVRGNEGRRWSGPAPQTQHMDTPPVEGLDIDASELTLAFALEEEEKAGVECALTPPRGPSSSGEESEPSSRRSSLTRPDNLPPKDPAEEIAHLKEYEKMVAQSVDKEKRKSAQEQKNAQKRALQIQNDTQTWHAWVQAGGSGRVSRDLVWRGIPALVRPAVWRIILTNGVPEVCIKSTATISPQIRDDVAQVWPELAIFAEGRPLYDALVGVVGTYLSYVPGVRYQRAIADLAGLLLLYMDEDDAVRALIKLLGPGTLPHAIIAGLEQVATANTASFKKIFDARFSQLAKHCEAVKLAPHDMANQLVVGCFASVLPDPEAAARIIDVLAFNGDSFLLRAALGLLRINEAWLFGTREEMLAQLTTPRVPSDDDLMDAIRNVTR